MNWSEEQLRQLNLFKSKRQRGRRPPAADEFELHCLIADVLKRWCYPTWRYTHVPLGEYRPPATAGRLKRMGVMPGWPDFQLFHMRGNVCFIELKRQSDGRATEAQEELAFFLIQAGHGFLLTNNFNDALGALKDWGVVPARITTMKANPDHKDMPWSPHPEAPIE